MDLGRLRAILRPLIGNLKDAATTDQLPILCDGLGLPAPDSEGSKRERMITAFDALPNEKLPDVGERFLELHPPTPSMRNQIQDLLWAGAAVPEIPLRYRREVAQALASEELYLDCRRFDALLDRLWVLDDDPLDFFLGGGERSLRAEIDRHVHRNPGDWSAEYLFDKLGAFDASDRRFALFLEGLASPYVRPDEAAQRRFVEIVNEPLRKCGVELRESGTDGGYPVFTLVSCRLGSGGRPKNLIFASEVKPDLRFRDAVNNDIEIVTNADKVLVYDRSIGMDGLRWCDLQEWWAETKVIADPEEAKATLYRRLRASLPQNSPPQTLLFEAFYRGFGKSVPDLPALLPEVWLHWDPKTVRERGVHALVRFRMDFLLLLPQGGRVVIEVDGREHYADATGRADCARYAIMVAADRELKLAGYEVFRFGAQELQEPAAEANVKMFFEAVLRRYGVIVR